MVLNVSSYLYKLDTLAFKIQNISLNIQQMSGEGMIDFKSIGISSDGVLKESYFERTSDGFLKEIKWKLFYTQWVSWKGVCKMYKWMSEFGLKDSKRFNMLRELVWRVGEGVNR